MDLNYSGKDLSGQSFRGKDLTGANFAYADIRGTDFTKAILRNADFSNAQSGLTRRWQMVMALFVIITAAIAVFTTWMGGLVTVETISPAFNLNSHLPTVNSYIPTIFVLGTLALFYGVLFTQGFSRAIVMSVILTGGTVFLLGSLIAIIYGGKGLEAIGSIFWQHIFNQNFQWKQEVDLKVLGTALWRAIAVLNWSLMATFCTALTVVMTGLSLWTTVLIGFESVVGARIIVFGLGLSPEVAPAKLLGQIIILLTLSIGVIFFSGIYSGYRALKEDDKYLDIRKLAIAFFALKGTSFRGANLTEANFNEAVLMTTDFREAILLRTKFHLSKGLDRARVGHTLLKDLGVRDLLVTHRGRDRSYKGRNLSGANLAGADLSDVNLTEADLSQATLEGACLERANLTKIQAIDTNFHRASLTGACLEAWNIDNTTQLDGMLCDFVYLQNGLQERRPSSGNFAPGECTRLFKVVLNTVDLIFQHGVDWKAFTLALNQVQLEHADIPLTIQSIEHKGDGIVVIRIEGVEAAQKEQVHANLTQSYAQVLHALEQSYQAQLQSKDEQIDQYRQQQGNLQELVQLLASRSVQIPALSARINPNKRVILKLGPGDLEHGFPVSLQIGAEGEVPYGEWNGHLDAAPWLLASACQWQDIYCQNLMSSRIDVLNSQTTNVGPQEFFRDCDQAAEQLKSELNQWLNAESFRSIKEQLLEQLSPSDTIRFILQTGDRQVQRLPLHLWDFFERYRKAELALSMPIYEQIERSHAPSHKVRILAILGDSTGINIEGDRHLLEQLPDTEVTFLIEPQRQLLNNHLWAKPWDILFFAGHSASRGECSEVSDNPGLGHIQINKTERLLLPQLKHALRKATERGLQLAIFNSCDGLGLAMDLAHLHIPQMIVMREPIPDLVAQEFLKNFLTAFSKETSLYQSVREAREQLQGLEDRFPCATWLPIICQNPAEALLTWRKLLDT